MSPDQIICIGASAGGVTALQHFFKSLPAHSRYSFVVVLHLPKNATVDPKLVFGYHFKGNIPELIDKMPIEPGAVYFAPSAYHLLVERDMTLSLSQDEPVNFARPSIDVLFESAARAFGRSARGVLMTGANADGAQGLLAIKSAGGMTFVQDPEEAETPYMPRAAMSLFVPDWVLNLKGIAAKLEELSGGTA